jgi:hypothetical protein
MIDVYFLISALIAYAMTPASSPGVAHADSVAAQAATVPAVPAMLVDSAASVPAVPYDSSAVGYGDKWHPPALYDYLDPNIPVDMLISSALKAMDIPEDEFNDSPVAPVRYAVPAEAVKLDSYMNGVSKGFDRRIRYALNGITTMPSRLLAMKYYLRRQGDIGGSWVWTRRQVDQFKYSQAYRQALAEVRQITKTFAEQNPGYTLHVNTEIRSLADQVSIWNSAPSVDASGAALYKQAIAKLADTTIFKDEPDGDCLTRFRQFLSACDVPAVPTAAVPGFSQHGQLRAFDFIIWAGDTAIAAGADAGNARAVWDNSGWTDKLNVAINTVSSSFEGPLMSPHEPWHYAYVE